MRNYIAKLWPMTVAVLLLSGCPVPIYEPRMEVIPNPPCIGSTITVRGRDIAGPSGKVYILLEEPNSTTGRIVIGTTETIWLSDTFEFTFQLASTVVSLDGKHSISIEPATKYSLHALVTDGKYTTPVYEPFTTCPE